MHDTRYWELSLFKKYLTTRVDHFEQQVVLNSGGGIAVRFEWDEDYKPKEDDADIDIDDEIDLNDISMVVDCDTLCVFLPYSETVFKAFCETMVELGNGFQYITVPYRMIQDFKLKPYEESGAI